MQPSPKKDRIRLENLGRAALAYARRGWKVFPLKPKSKEPLTKNGFKDATTDAKIIKKWWTQYPLANIGLPCESNNLVVIDLDRHKGKKNGIKAFRKICRNESEIQTLTSVTGSRGRHLVFQSPNRDLRGQLCEGIDIKHKGYIVLPPSIHPSGGIYVWIDTEAPIAKLPLWLLKRCLSSPKIRQKSPSKKDAMYPPSDGELIIARCPFMAHWAKNAHALSELEWYLGIGVLAYTMNGHELIHKHSSDYGNYDPDETEQKITHWLNDGFGPATCQTIKEKTNDEYCQHCLYNNP